MEVKYPVAASVIIKIRNCLELFTIAFAIVLPLAATAFALPNKDFSMWKIMICGALGTLIWWYLCWFAFWFIV
jgi:hypothetical protein